MDDEKLFDEYDEQVGVAVDKLIAAPEPDNWEWDSWWKEDRSFLKPGGSIERPPPPRREHRKVEELPVYGPLDRVDTAGSYIRDKLREASYRRQIIPPLKPQSLGSVSHDSIAKIVEIEPDARAMAITFRGINVSRIIRK